MEFLRGNNLKGDYLEFGIYTGNSFVSANYFAEKFNLNHIRFFAFDSFEGLPEIKGVDNESIQFRKGQFECNIFKFKKILRKNKINFLKTFLIKGWYDEVLNNNLKMKHNLNNAAIINIDCDLYESTVPVLNFITSLLNEGTILIFDDWNCFNADPKKGERKAVTQWLKKNKHIKLEPFYNFGWHGKSFMVHKSN